MSAPLGEVVVAGRVRRPSSAEARGMALTRGNTWRTGVNAVNGGRR